MKELKIMAFDHDSMELDILANVTMTTPLAIAPKWGYYRNLFFLGWNLYAIDGEKAVLLETYDSKEEIIWSRKQIIKALKKEDEIIII